MTLNNYKPNFAAVVEQLKNELTKFRTSRATPNLVEDVIVEVYGGSRMKIKELATISIPETRTLVIKPWDKNIIKEIEKALISSTLEFNPILDSDILRINLPELTEENRLKLVKKLHAMLEESRIKLRGIRDDIKKEIERQQKNGEITEDDRYSLIEELNDMTKKNTEQIEELGQQKETEIMTI